MHGCVAALRRRARATTSRRRQRRRWRRFGVAARRMVRHCLRREAARPLAESRRLRGRLRPIRRISATATVRTANTAPKRIAASSVRARYGAEASHQRVRARFVQNGATSPSNFPCRSFPQQTATRGFTVHAAPNAPQEGIWAVRNRTNRIIFGISGPENAHERAKRQIPVAKEAPPIRPCEKPPPPSKANEPSLGSEGKAQASCPSRTDLALTHRGTSSGSRIMPTNTPFEHQPRQATIRRDLGKRRGECGIEVRLPNTACRK